MSIGGGGGAGGGMGGGGMGGGGMGGGGVGEGGQECIELLIPANKVGLVIGECFFFCIQFYFQMA